MGVRLGSGGRGGLEAGFEVGLGGGGGRLGFCSAAEAKFFCAFKAAMRSARVVYWGSSTSAMIAGDDELALGFYWRRWKRAICDRRPEAGKRRDEVYGKLMRGCWKCKYEEKKNERGEAVQSGRFVGRQAQWLL